VTGIRERLEILQAFAKGLFSAGASKGVYWPKSAFEVGPVADAVVPKFAPLHSPALRESPGKSRLRMVIRGELVRSEEKLYGATVAPRPRLAREFLEWAQARFVLFPGNAFPLSQFVFAMTVFAHNLLALEAAPRDERKAIRVRDAQTDKQRHENADKEVQRHTKRYDVARRALPDDRLRLEAPAPTPTDMLAAYRALLSLRRRIAGRGDWAILSESFAARNGWEDCLRLAACSPLAQVLEPELAALLTAHHKFTEHDDLRPWRHLRILLEDEHGGPLRQHMLAGLVSRALTLRDGDRGRILKTLHKVLDTGVPGGVLMVGEFLMTFAKQVFADPRLDARKSRSRPDWSTSQAEGFQLLKEWFWSPNSRIETVSLLVGFLRGKAKVDRSRGFSDERSAMLRTMWHELSEATTHGLRLVSWQREVRRRMQIFWLIFGKEALDGGLTQGLNTGSPDWDELATLVSRLYKELYRGVNANRRHQERRARIAASLAQDQNDPPVLDEDEQRQAKEFAAIGNLLAECIGGSVPRRSLSPFHRALRVHGILVPNEKNDTVLVVDPRLNGEGSHA